MFKIYGTDGNNQIQAQETADLVAALRISREMRDAGYSFVTAYFSDRGRLFQSDRGRRFSAIVDAQGCAQARV